MADNNVSYGKRPLWQWILLYLLIGGIIYALIYFAFLKNKYSPSQYNSQQPSPAANQQTSPSPSQSSENVTIEYNGSGFNPKSITIKAGQTITWMNKDTDPLQIASNPHPTHTEYPPLNTVGLIQPGESKSFTFPQAGTYGYHNHLEPGNTGEVIVQ